MGLKIGRFLKNALKKPHKASNVRFARKVGLGVAAGVAAIAVPGVGAAVARGAGAAARGAAHIAGAAAHGVRGVAGSALHATQVNLRNAPGALERINGVANTEPDTDVPDAVSSNDYINRAQPSDEEMAGFTGAASEADTAVGTENAATGQMPNGILLAGAALVVLLLVVRK